MLNRFNELNECGGKTFKSTIEQCDKNADCEALYGIQYSPASCIKETERVKEMFT